MLKITLYTLLYLVIGIFTTVLCVKIDRKYLERKFFGERPGYLTTFAIVWPFGTLLLIFMMCPDPIDYIIQYFLKEDNK